MIRLFGFNAIQNMRMPYVITVLLCLILFNNNKAYAASEHMGIDLIIGERVFYGLVETGNPTQSCIGCHAIYASDTLNWNPTASEVALSASKLDSTQFKNLFQNPSGAKLESSHSPYKLTDKQIKELHSYLVLINETGFKKQKHTYNNLIILILLIIIILAAKIDLFFTHFIKYKPIHIIIILLAAGYIVKMATQEATDLGRSQNYEPDQPIKFSHKVHAKQNKIDCLYCHTNADEGKSAGIPSMNVCMNCHSIVREGSNSGKFEIAKLIDHVDKNKPIEWIKIHDLPDHVYFNHEQHVKVGKLNCTECHGDVENMDRVKQVSDLSMGWCLDCHKEKGIDAKGNGYYQHNKKVLDAIHANLGDTITAAQMGANDCMKCHY